MCRLYSSTYPSMPGTEIRVLWKSSLIYLCFDVTAVSSIESLWYCWSLVSHKPGSVMSAPPPTSLTFSAHSISRRVSQLAKGITSKFLQTPDVFTGSTQREETFSILCKHLSDKSLCHGGDTSLEWVKGLHSSAFLSACRVYSWKSMHCVEFPNFFKSVNCRIGQAQYEVEILSG